MASMLIFLRMASDYDNGTAFQVGAFLLYFFTIPLIWMVKEPVDYIINTQNHSPPREIKSIFKHRESAPFNSSRKSLPKDRSKNNDRAGNTGKNAEKRNSLDF